MSHLFEALQKSIAERSGTEQGAALAATELLERAERQAASERKTKAGAMKLTDAQEGSILTSPSLSEIFLDTSSEEPSVTVEQAEEAGREDAFSEFSSVEVSPQAESRLVCLVDKESPAAEAFRLLAVRLRDLRKNRPLKKVLITSTVPQEGKSFAAANLACTLALNPQQKTLLIEGDVRQPSLWCLFGMAPTPGICEYLRGERSLTASIYRLEIPGIWFLAAGSPQDEPLRIIQSTKLPPMMDQLAQWFDWIIIDSPPVLPLADTTALARLSDGILLVTRRGTTKKRKLEKGLEALEPDKMIGALLNFSNGTTDNEYYYYHRGRRG